MPRVNDPLRVLVLRAKKLLDEESFLQALAALQEADEQAHDRAVPTSWVSWAKCVALDNLGRPIEALAAVDEALEHDAGSAPAHISRDIVLRRVREILSDAAAPHRERLAAYDALANAGEIGYAEHLARVDLLCTAGMRNDALDLALSIEALWPTVEVRRRINALRAEFSS